MSEYRKTTRLHLLPEPGPFRFSAPIWRPTEEDYQELERRGRDILRTLGRDQPSDVPPFPLESDDRRTQRLLDRFAFRLDWPEEERFPLGPKIRRPYAWKKIVK